jgi:hypothetical protein
VDALKLALISDGIKDDSEVLEKSIHAQEAGAWQSI